MKLISRLGLHELKRANFKQDSIVELANSLATESSILCLDEFQVGFTFKITNQPQVTDISDAMILSRLFRELFKHPFILVTTSNRAPDRLYENGLQREGFLPCISLIKTNCDVFCLNSGSDYRKANLNGPSQTFFYPINEFNGDIFEKLFLDLIGTDRIEPVNLCVFGRTWTISNAASTTAKFFYSDLCEQVGDLFIYYRHIAIRAC